MIKKLLELTNDNLETVLNYLLEQKRGYRDELAKEFDKKGLKGEDLVSTLASLGLISQGGTASDGKDGFRRTWQIIEKRVNEYILIFCPMKEMTKDEQRLGEYLYELGLR